MQNGDGVADLEHFAEPVRDVAWNLGGLPVIAYTTTTDGLGDLWVVNTENGQKQQLTGGDTSRESTPVWFADGRTIAFERRGLQADVVQLGFVDDLAAVHLWLSAADVAVGLRSLYWGETPASALRVLANGLPLIVNDVGAFAELPDSACVKVSPDVPDTGEALCLVLEELYREPKDTGDDGVWLSDGYIYFAILKHGPNTPKLGPDQSSDYCGIHHIGFMVDDQRA